jgi:hypothetical protein
MMAQTWTDTMVVQKAWKMAKSFVDDTTKLKAPSEAYWKAVRRRHNELMLTQPQWEPFLRSELLTSERFMTRNVMAFRSPIEAMWNVGLRANADVVNARTPQQKKQAKKHRRTVWRQIAASMAAYRAVKWTYYGTLAAIPSLLLTGKLPEEEEKKGATWPEALMYDLLNIIPIGPPIVAAVKLIVNEALGRRRGFGFLERLPIGGIINETEKAFSHSVGTIRNLVLQDFDEAKEDIGKAALAIAMIASTLKGVPLNAPVTAVKPWFEERDDITDEWLANFDKPLTKEKK